VPLPSHTQGHLKAFSEEVQELGVKILQAALALHERVSSTFRKTAINFHYEFTVRHLANVFQGLLMSTPDTFNTASKWGKLWLHESERVYADRLVSSTVSPSPCLFCPTPKCISVTRWWPKRAKDTVLLHTASWTCGKNLSA
jgi:hypothetical protein